MNDVQKLQTIGINITSMRKGDSYSRQQVEDAFYILESDVAERLQPLNEENDKTQCRLP